MAEQIKAEELEPKNETQVDLDTSNLKEQDVEVKEQEKKEEPKLNVGEVDLGYADHEKVAKDKAEIKVVQETEEAPKKEESKQEEIQEEPVNLKKKKDDYQSRINQLTGRYRESQRREKAALDYAKSLQKKIDDVQKKYTQTDEQYLKEVDARVDAQREQVKIVLKDAVEKGDHDKQMEALDKLTQLGVQKEKARLELENRAEVRKQQEQEQKQNVEAKTSSETVNQPETISPRAKKWAEENTWFGNDEVMTSAAEKIHKNVILEGIEVDSDEYYNEIDTRLKKYFKPLNQTNDEPKVEQRKPVQTVASAGRKQEGRRTVRLTASQVAIAKKLNVPLDEYAKYVKEDK